MRPAVMGFLSRLAMFSLASVSFACLIGQFYGLWSMKPFACWVLLPATAAIIAWGLLSRGVERSRIIQGTLGGLVAAIAYDLYRLPFVLDGAPLFKVFPRFGELLLGSDEPRWLVHLLGWAYHFSNGAALGIMFLAMMPRLSRWGIFLAAIGWAMLVECLLLLTPYTEFFGLKFNARFLFLTASAHLVFGIALGCWCQWRGKLQRMW